MSGTGTVRADRAVTSGTFTLDGETFDVDLGRVFTGDTLFHGGPGATGRSYSDRPALEASIRTKLFALPNETVVHTGHGEDTTIGDERSRLEARLGHRRRPRRQPGDEAVP